MRVLSLFDGISCGHLALDRANIPIANYFASEIDKYAIRVSSAMFPDIKHIGDVRSVKGADLPKIDLLIGGSPCQDLSLAGGRAGLEGARSGLFWEYVRVLEETKPKYFLLENVIPANVQDAKTISKILGVDPVCINSALVSAQNRERLYWTNIPGTEATLFGNVIAQPEDRGIFLKDILEKEFEGNLIVSQAVLDRANRKKYSKYKLLPQKTGTLSCSNNSPKMSIDSGTTFIPVRISDLGSDTQGYRVYSIIGKSISLGANGGGLGVKTGLYKIDLPDGNYIVRRLSPRECCRLQTYDERCFDLCLDISNTQWYKIFGNGWTVDVIAHIFKGINPREVNER